MHLCWQKNGFSGLCTSRKIVQLMKVTRPTAPGSFGTIRAEFLGRVLAVTSKLFTDHLTGHGFHVRELVRVWGGAQVNFVKQIAIERLAAPLINFLNIKMFTADRRR